MKIEIAENIRRMRNEKDLTQEQLAEQIGVSAQSVSRWETDASYPDIHQHNLLGFAENIHRVFYNMSHWSGNTLQKIGSLKKSVDVFNIVLGDNKGFFSGRVSDSYLRMARLYCETENIENAVEALENSEKYAVMYETRPEGGKYGVYWLELIEDIRRLQTAKNTEKNQYEAILEALEGKDFNIIRDDDRFNKHNSELKKQSDNI